MLKIKSLLVLMFCALTAAASAKSSLGWDEVGNANFRFLFKKITNATLLVSATQSRASLFDVSYPKRIEIEYFVSASAQKLAELTEENLYSRSDWLALDDDAKQEAAEFLSWYRDVEPGDKYQLEWQVAGGRFAGLVLSFNGEVLGTVAEAEIATVLLGVWLGPEAISVRQSKRLEQAWQAWVLNQS